MLNERSVRVNTREGLLSLLVRGPAELPVVAADLDGPALKPRSRRGHPRWDVRVGSGATRTKVLPKFSPRSISAKAVGMTSNPSRISSR